jgi:hypothetical protein
MLFRGQIYQTPKPNPYLGRDVRSNPLLVNLAGISIVLLLAWPGFGYCRR